MIPIFMPYASKPHSIGQCRETAWRYGQNTANRQMPAQNPGRRNTVIASFSCYRMPILQHSPAACLLSLHEKPGCRPACLPIRYRLLCNPLPLRPFSAHRQPHHQPAPRLPFPIHGLRPPPLPAAYPPSTS